MKRKGAQGGGSTPEAGRGAPQGQQPGRRTPGPGQPGQRGQSAPKLDVSKKELKAFNKIRKEVQPIQKKKQEEHRKMVENSDMGEQRYQRIILAQRQNKNPQMSQAEQKEMKKIRKKGQEIQKELQEKVLQKVEENEVLDQERFSKIARGLQQDPELQRRLRKLSGEGQAGGSKAPTP